MKTITRLFLILVASGLSLGMIAQDTWTQKASFAGGERFGPAAFSVDDKGYFGMGNDINNQYPSDFWEYDPTTDQWTQMADFPGPVRNHPSGFTIGHKGYVAGGGYTPGDYGWVWYNDLWEYDPGTNSWTQRASFDAIGRSLAIGFSINGKGYIGTGMYRESRATNSIFFNDLWEYDPVADSWAQKANFPGEGRMGSTAVVIGNKAYAGLGQYWYSTFLNDWWAYDPITDAWTQKTDFPSYPRTLPTGFTIGDKGYVGLGVYYAPQSELAKDIWQYDPTQDSWTRKADLPLPLYAAKAFTLGCKAYVGTGDSGPNFEDRFYEYTPDVSINVTIPDVWAVNPGGDPNTIYLGYGPTYLTLEPQVSGGYPFEGGSYDYLWSDGSSNDSFNAGPSSAGDHTYSVTAIDRIGCTGTGQKTISVIDARCGTNLEKVIVCKSSPGYSDNVRAMCISPNAVDQHLRKGSHLANCPEVTSETSTVDVYPNPSPGIVNVQIMGMVSTIQIRITDRNGKMITSRTIQSDGSTQTEMFDLSNARPGMYIVTIRSNDGTSSRKIFVSE